MPEFDSHPGFPAPGSFRWPGLCSILILALVACAQYREKPLPETAELQASINSPTVDSQTVSKSGSEPSVLDMPSAVTFALAHNPQLRALQQQELIADAQLLSARLLPDPQLSLGLDHPTSSQPDLINAFNAGLSYELTALMTRGIALDAAIAGSNQARFDFIWQQWQVAQQVRTLYANCLYEAQSLVLLKAVETRLEQQNGATQRALKNRDLDLNAASTDLAAFSDIQNQRAQLSRQHIATQHDLNLVLGVPPTTEVQLQALPAPGSIDIASARAKIANLSERRPDLLALQSGYASQEARLRQAILEQYPGISVGISRARDTSAVYTNGFNIALNLPLFSANRPAIALEQATREQLYEEYRASLASSASAVDHLLRVQQEIEAQQNVLVAQLPLLSDAEQKTDSAFRNTDVDSHARNAATVALLNAQLQQTDLQRAGWENRIALETLLAWSPPPLTTSLNPVNSKSRINDSKN